MGLIYNILIGAVHLLFVVMDIFFVMIAVKIIYDRWRPSVLKQTVTAIAPLTALVLDYVKEVSVKITGRTYSEKTLLLLIIICLSVIRLIAISLLIY